MQLKKYVDQEVTIVTLANTGYRSWTEKTGDVPITQRENNEDNLVMGLAREATSDTITVEHDYRGKTFTYEIAQHAIAWIMTTTLNESGKAQSDRMKAQHAEAKK